MICLYNFKLNQNSNNCLYKNKAFNARKPSAIHITLSCQECMTGSLFEHIWGGITDENCRETSWGHFGFNRRTTLHSINWTCGCMTCVML